MNTPPILVPSSPKFRMIQELMMELVSTAGSDNLNWFPDQALDLVHHTLALCGEVGELANLVKKVDRNSTTIEEAEVRLRDELADVFTYFLSIYAIIGGDPFGDYMTKRDFNQERFSNE